MDRANDPRAKRLTRRAFARRGLLLGVAASAAGGLLAACGTRAGTSPGGGAGVPQAATRPTPIGPTPLSVTGATRVGVTDSEVLIGSWGPQDGPAGVFGVIDRTIDAYFKQVNAGGGVAGRAIRFVYENDSYQPAKTVAAVKKLVEEDRVFALLAGAGTPNNLAVEAYLVERNIPHLAPSTGSSLMAQPLKRNIFAVQTSYTAEATLLTRHALDALGSRRMAVFFQNDAFGKEGLGALAAELRKRGLPGATEVSYETTDKDFSAQALKLQASGADTVIIWAVPRPGGTIIQELTRIGFAPRLLATSIINDPAIFDLAGPGIEGLVSTAWLPEFGDTAHPPVAAYQDFMRRHAPDLPIGTISQIGYASAELLIEALARVGRELTRERFLQTLETFEWSGGMIPRVRFTPDNHQGSSAVHFQQARGGRFAKISDFVEYTA